MNKKNSELIYTQRLREYYLRCKTTDLDKIDLLLRKKNVTCNQQNNHLEILNLDNWIKFSWSYINFLGFWINRKQKTKQKNKK